MSNNSSILKKDLTHGPVAIRLFLFTSPMLLGMFSSISFNLVDTWFVAQLGNEALAAMSFTFPVIMVLGALALGLGTGTSTVVSRAAGAHDADKVRRLTTDSLILSTLIVGVCIFIGLKTIDPLFTMLGASPSILVLIRSYMIPWYLGLFFLVIPIVANSALRARGDAKWPSLVMTLGAVVNMILDPILIFGSFGMPGMGLKGAAIATVIARAVTLIFCLWLLYSKEKMICFKLKSLLDIIRSWIAILHIGLPSSATKIVVPASVAIITRIVSSHGPEAVAAVGAGSRVTAFAAIPFMALCSTIVPFVGQNWGGNHFKRARLSKRYSFQFCMFWGIVIIATLFHYAPDIARQFSSNPEVVHMTTLYLQIVPWCYGMMGIFRVSESILNAIGRPLQATLLTTVNMLGLCVPFSWIGSLIGGMPGLLVGMTLANIMAGVLAYFRLYYIFYHTQKKLTLTEG